MGSSKRLDELLDVHNYATWKIRMEALLFELGLKPAILAAPSTQEDIDRSNKAIAVMIKNVKDHHLAAITSAANAKAAWDALASTYAATSNARRLQLRQQLTALKKSADEPLTKYVARARQLHADLLGAGHAMPTTELAWAILAGLPESYNVITTVLMARDGDLDLETITSKLLQHETALGVASKLPQEAETTAFVAQSTKQHASRSEDRHCYLCGKKGHVKVNCPFKQNTREWPQTLAF